MENGANEISASWDASGVVGSQKHTLKHMHIYVYTYAYTAAYIVRVFFLLFSPSNWFLLQSNICIATELYVRVCVYAVSSPSICLFTMSYCCRDLMRFFWRLPICLTIKLLTCHAHIYVCVCIVDIIYCSPNSPAALSAPSFWSTDSYAYLFVVILHSQLSNSQKHSHIFTALHVIGYLIPYRCVCLHVCMHIPLVNLFCS